MGTDGMLCFRKNSAIEVIACIRWPDFLTSEDASGGSDATIVPFLQALN